MPELAPKPITNFKELPDPLKGWLASSQLTFLISDLNRRLGFREEEEMRVIPTLILRLAISSVEPEEFVSQLSKLLDISPSAAHALAQEIEEKMLRPVETVLRSELGIDIKLIHFGKEIAPEKEFVPQMLIPSPEVAHPTSEQSANPVQVPASGPMPMPPTPSSVSAAPRQVVTPPPSAPVTSPVYTPSAPSQPAPQPKPATPPTMTKPPMPKVEPLALSKTEPLQERKAPTPPSIPVKVKVEPSKVPSFLKDSDFK